MWPSSSTRSIATTLFCCLATKDEIAIVSDSLGILVESVSQMSAPALQHLGMENEERRCINSCTCSISGSVSRQECHRQYQGRCRPYCQLELPKWV